MRFNPLLALALAGFLLAHFLLPHTIRWGAIWDSRARPVPAEVALNGSTYRGVLARGWDDSLLLTDGSGRTVLHVRAGDPATVTYHPAADALSPAAWRRFLPFVLLALVSLLCCLPAVAQVVRRLRGRAPAA